MAARPNTPSGPGALVTLDATGKLPALDGSQLLNIGSTVLLEDHMVTSNLVSNTIAKLGWRTSGNGTGNAISVTSVPDRPGVLSMTCGVATATGKRALQLGQTTSPGGFVLSISGQMQSIEVEWVIRIRGTISPITLEVIQLGLVDAADEATNGQVLNGIVVKFNPTASSAFRVMASNGGVSSIQNGTTVVALDTWYRVAFVYTDTGSGGSLQLKVNGVNQGSPVTENFPTGALGLFAKIDGQGAGTIDPFIDIDRVRVYGTPSLP